MEHKIVIKDVNSKISAEVFKLRRFFGWKKLKRYKVNSTDKSLVDFCIRIWVNRLNIPSDKIIYETK